MKSLTQEQLDTQLRETRDILDAHADIQHEHRDQAKWILRVYVAGVGLLIASFAWVVDQFFTVLSKEASALNDVVTIGAYVLFILLSMGGFYLLIRAFFRFIGILELVAAVLTPQKFGAEFLPLRVLRLVPWYTRVAEVDIAASANETVERVIEAERLLSSMEEPPDRRERVLVDRLCRIQRNERSIDRDMRFLESTYKILSESLPDALIGGVLVVASTELAPLFT